MGGRRPRRSLIEMDHATNALSFVHQFERLINVFKPHGVGDEIVEFELALQIPLDNSRKLGAAFDAAERGAFPDSTGHQLEWTGGNLLASTRDTDDDGDSVPTADEPGDTDEDGTDDYLDTDDDDDGIPTLEEAAWTDSDVDGDDVPNWRDLDSDGDALSDEEEGTVDTDDDGVPDYLDPDGAYGTYYKGGCTLDHTRGLSFGWLALLLPLVVRRRRTQ